MEQFKKANENIVLYNELNQKILDVEKVKAIAELETKYQTEKKEKELIVKEQSIELLKKEQKIKNYTLYGLVTGFSMLTIIAFLWFRIYNQKKKEKEIKSQHQVEMYMKEIDVLQENINRLVTESPIQINAAIINENINQYLATPLSDRELEVLKELAQKKTNKEIANSLFVSINTIKTHLLSIYEKLDVKNRNQAIKKVGGMVGVY